MEKGKGQIRPPYEEAVEALVTCLSCRPLPLEELEDAAWAPFAEHWVLRQFLQRHPAIFTFVGEDPVLVSLREARDDTSGADEVVAVLCSCLMDGPQTLQGLAQACAWDARYAHRFQLEEFLLTRPEYFTFTGDRIGLRNAGAVAPDAFPRTPRSPATGGAAVSSAHSPRSSRMAAAVDRTFQASLGPDPVSSSGAGSGSGAGAGCGSGSGSGSGSSSGSGMASNAILGSGSGSGSGLRSVSGSTTQSGSTKSSSRLGHQGRSGSQGSTSGNYGLFRQPQRPPSPPLLLLPKPCTQPCAHCFADPGAELDDLNAQLSALFSETEAVVLRELVTETDPCF